MIGGGSLGIRLAREATCVSKTGKMKRNLQKCGAIA